MTPAAIVKRFFAAALSKSGAKKGAAVAEGKKKIVHAFQVKKKVRKSGRSSDDSARFKDALFSVEPDRPELRLPVEVLAKREIIAKAWSRYCSSKNIAFERQGSLFLASKIKAIEELEQLSPELAAKARELDYSLPPLRRLPSLVPPIKSPFI